MIVSTYLLLVQMLMNVLTPHAIPMQLARTWMVALRVNVLTIMKVMVSVVLVDVKMDFSYQLTMQLNVVSKDVPLSIVVIIGVHICMCV